MSEKQKIALELFTHGMNCAQAVVGAFCEDYGFDKKNAMLMATGFGGGMRTGGACGALTGALMVVGMACGTYKVENDQDAQQKAECARRTIEFTEAFRELKGTVNCKELWVRPKMPKKIKRKGPPEICIWLVEQSVRLLEEKGY